jgi:hypothetical protein
VNKRDIVFLSLLLVVILWFTQGMILYNQVPFFRDLGPYFYPMRFSLAQAFRAGEVPLWDRHMGMGFPLLADFQSGSFYPPHFLLIVLPFFTAIRILYVLHYLVAGIGAYKLCRHWGYPPYLGLIGGMLFSLGGTLISLSNLLNHFQTAVWLPWVVLLGEKTILLATWNYVLPLAFVSLLQFLAGSPELYLMTLGLLMLDGLRLHKGYGLVSRIKALLPLCWVQILVLGMAMVQVLPTAELLMESRGGNRVDYSESVMWSLQPWSLLNVFFVDKEVAPELLNALNLLLLQKIPLLISHYLGPLSMLGMVLWLTCGTRKGRVLLSGLLTLSVLVAMGSYTPVYPLTHKIVPFVDLFRFPEKFFFLAYALIIFMSLEGLHEFLEGPPSASRPGRRAVFLIFGICLSLYLFCRIESAALARFVAWTSNEKLFSSVTVEKTSAALLNLERGLALITGFSLLMFLANKGKLNPLLMRWLLPALLFVDLNSANQPHHHLLRPSFAIKGPTILDAREAERHRLFYYPAHSHLHPSFYVLARDPPPSFAEVQSILFANLLPNAGLVYGFDFMQEIDALRRWPYLNFLHFADKQPPPSLYKLLAALNVQYLISFQPLPAGGIRLVRYFPEYPSWLYEVDAPVPRAYIVARATEEKNPSKILEKLADDGFDAKHEVIVDRHFDFPAAGERNGQVKIRDYTSQRVSLDATVNKAGILVLADSYYPGWRAYVNGEERVILRANLFFRAVHLPAGSHRIEFRYEPVSFRVGLVISLLSFVALLLAILYRGRWQSQR